MSNYYRKELEKVKKKRENYGRKLEEESHVPIYRKMLKLNELLMEKEMLLKDLAQREEYENCKHIFVCSSVLHECYEGITTKEYGCIKCGLDTSIRKEYYRRNLTEEERVMYEYLEQKSKLTGIYTKNDCDLALARSIYAKIKEAHPKIKDETALKYFEIALADIRNIEVGEERKENRAKRLLLSPNFNKWNKDDIIVEIF